jgi:flagellar basal-body rod protein FlgB
MSNSSFTFGNWVGRTVQLLSRSLDLRSQRHAVIASNLANIDTPGYKPLELTFEKQLQQATGQGGPQPIRTHQHHLPGDMDDVAKIEPRLRQQQEYALGNGSYHLDLDKEMARLAKNSLAYEVTVQLISKKLAGLRLAINEGGK